MAGFTGIIKTLADLTAQTTAADTDVVPIGITSPKKITIANLKEALGIGELNRKFAVLTDTFPSTGNIKTVPYPSGFTVLNCMLIGIVFYHNTFGWMQLPNDYTKTAEISTLTAGVRVKPIDSGLANVQIKIMLFKIA